MRGQSGREQEAAHHQRGHQRHAGKEGQRRVAHRGPTAKRV